MQEQMQEIKVQTIKAVQKVVTDFFNKEKKIEGIDHMITQSEFDRFMDVL